MSAPYVNRRVTVTGTSKPELNGQRGRATGYNNETFRYNVLLDNGRTVSLKMTNLIPEAADEDSGGGGGGFPGVGQMPGMPDMNKLLAMLPPWLVTKLTRGEMPTLTDLQRLLPAGITTTHAGISATIIVLMMYKIGMFKTIMFAMVLSYIVYNGYPPYVQAGGGVAGLKAAGHCLGQKVSAHIFLSTKQNLSPQLSLGALGVVVVAVLYYVFLNGVWDSATTGGAYFSDSSGGVSLSSVAEQAYAEGYEHGQAGLPPDWTSSNSRRYAAAAAAATADRTHITGSGPSRSSSSGLFGGFGLGKLFSLGLLARQVYSLGAGPAGGWDIGLAQANLMQLPTMQKIFLGMNLLRVFGMSPL